MNVNHTLEHQSEPNQQVNEQDKTSTDSDTKGQQETSKTTGDEKTDLEARVQSLKQTIASLKSQLLEEKDLWKKEVELMKNLISSNEGYLEYDVSANAEGDIKPMMNYPDALASSPLIRDYEEKLNRYQGALAQAQAEKRLHIRRQIAANTYRKRLSEVEKMCQEELDKVRETATFLEPLKQMALEWNKSKEPPKSPTEKNKRRSTNVECGGDFLSVKGRETQTLEEGKSFEVPVKQIDASLVMDEDASNEIKGKIVLQIGSLPTEVPTVCYSAKFE